MDNDDIYSTKDIKVHSRGGESTGKTTGRHRLCHLEGCRGLRLSVKWPDGKTTFPCTDGMIWDEKKKEWKIG